MYHFIIFSFFRKHRGHFQWFCLCEALQLLQATLASCQACTTLSLKGLTTHVPFNSTIRWNFISFSSFHRYPSRISKFFWNIWRDWKVLQKNKHWVKQDNLLRKLKMLKVRRMFYFLFMLNMWYYISIQSDFFFCMFF